MPPTRTNKITKEILNIKYDDLYKRAVHIIENLNPCQIQSKAGCTTCIVIREKIDVPYNIQENTLCCSGGPAGRCKWLGKDGCRVKSLRCKIWFCSTNLIGYSRGGTQIPDPKGLFMTAVHNRQHERIIADMIRFKFHTYFRGTKEQAVNYAYEHRDEIELHEGELDHILALKIKHDRSENV